MNEPIPSPASEEPGPSDKPQTSARWTWRLSVWLSVAVHVAILVALVWIPYHYWREQPDDPTKPAASTTADGSEARAPEPLPPAPKIPEPEDLSSERVQRQLDEMIEQAERLTPEEQRERLDRLGRRFEEISSPEHVERIAERMQEWLGTEARASAPAAEPVEGSFDHNTGQVHDVQLTNVNGTKRYQVVLVDAKGRTLEVEVDDDVGQQLHEVFVMIKKYPLLEEVYRRVAMPLLDQLLEQQRR